jgi:hypothetical protein
MRRLLVLLGLVPPAHRHDFREYVGRRCEGATLNWAGSVDPCFALTYRCECGQTETTSGWLLPLVPVRRDADGWPLDETGARMIVAPIEGKL